MRPATTTPTRDSGAMPCRPQPANSFALSTTNLTYLVGNVSLKEILAFVKVSKSTAYCIGLVPMYEKDGATIREKAPPPFPWLRLPAPIVKTGKKLWNADDVMAWHSRIHTRALSTHDSDSNDNQFQCEVPHGN